MSKKFLVSGLVGALVFTGVGFTGGNDTTRFLGPVAVEASTKAVGNVESLYSAEFEKVVNAYRNVEVLNMERTYLSSSVVELTKRLAVVESDLVEADRRVKSLTLVHKASVAEEVRLRNEVKKFETELYKLRKTEEGMVKRKDTKGLVDVRKRIDEVSSILKARNGTLNTQMAKSKDNFIDVNSWKFVFAETKKVRDNQLKLINAEKRLMSTISGDIKKSDELLKKSSATKRSLGSGAAQITIQREIDRVNGKKLNKTVADYKKDLEVLERFSDRHQIDFTTLSRYHRDSFVRLVELEKSMESNASEFARIKGNRAYDEYQLGLDFAHVRDSMKDAKDSKALLVKKEKELADLNRRVGLLSKSTKPADRDALVALNSRISRVKFEISDARSIVNGKYEDTYSADYLKNKKAFDAYSGKLLTLKKEKDRLKDLYAQAVYNERHFNEVLVGRMELSTGIKTYREELLRKIQ